MAVNMCAVQACIKFILQILFEILRYLKISDDSHLKPVISAKIRIYTNPKDTTAGQKCDCQVRHVLEEYTSKNISIISSCAIKVVVVVRYLWYSPKWS